MRNEFTEGSVSRTLFRFSLPILLANLAQASMLLINGLWVGNLLGSAAFAALTVGTTVMVVVLAFVLGMNNATLTIFAQLKGAGKQASINAYLSTFCLILAGLSALIGVGGYFSSALLLSLLNTPAPIMDAAHQYLQINFIGTLFLTGYNFVGTLLRAFGDSKTPLYFVLLATGLTAILDPIFIAGFGLGLNGAALATVLAQAIAFLASVCYLARRPEQRSFRFKMPRLEEVTAILRLGVPSGVQMIVIYAGMTTILSLVNTFGDHVVAGFGVAQRLDNIILLPAVALGAAVNAMAAQNIGAARWERVAQISRAGIVFNLIVMSACAVLLFLLAEPLVGLFLQHEDSMAFGVSYLRTIAVFYPFIGLNFILNGVVRGAGAMLQVLLLNIISLWVLRVPLTFWMTTLYGDAGIALGIGTSFLISSGCSVAYYRWGGWRRKRLFDAAG